MERRRVVITGLGAVTPIGLTAAESWQAVKDGVCGIAPITQFDPTDLKVHLAAEVKGFVPENYMSKPEAKRMGRFTQMAVVSAKEALDGAGFTLDEAEADRCGVIVSSGIGGLSITEAEHDKGKEKGWDRVSPFYIPTGICNMAAGQIAIHTGFRGMCSCPVTACTGGTNAVGDAFHYIRDGYADVMLCGGTESAVTPLAIGAFTSMKALTQNPDPKRASIPFDAERSGFVLGEGAAILLLEELEHAKARGARNPCGGRGLRRHLRRLSHDRSPARRQRGRQGHGDGPCRRRRQAGGCGLYQRPRHLHPPERRRRDGRRQDCVR